MIVPSYWAEARKQYLQDRKQITVRRFGWSDLSQEQAEEMAESRADEALRRAISGDKVSRREPKVAYNGAEGVPIREEVIARHGVVVITRNAYGAKCLNTPDVLFADIDFPVSGSLKFKFAFFAMMLGLAAFLGWQCEFRAWGIAVAVLSMFISSPLVDFINRIRIKALGGAERLAKKRVLRFLAKNPTWNIRLYRTPAGLRLLATHQPFQPGDGMVQEFYRTIDADPIYVRMCLNQQCFRARLTAKPWRIGISTHMKPRPGVWPVRPERIGERAGWLAVYDARAAGFASCKFIESIGSGITHPKVAPVVALHDEESRARVSGATIA
ncbi:MAG: hypothetical protein LUQ11_13475 [Methylococcaceae bacterium]|nr:hypothetical protein [Methylococcaceae bacterium]